MDNLMSPEKAYEGYYAVLKETTDQGGIFSGVNFKAISSDLSIVSKNIYEDFLEIINQLITFEKKKEQSYLLRYYNKYKILSPELESQLKDLLFSDHPDFGRAFELIEIHRYQLRNEATKLELNLNDWEKYLSSFNNKFFIDTSNEAIQNLTNIGSMSPESILNYLIEYIKNKYFGISINAKYKNDFESFMNVYAPTLINIVKSMKIFKGSLWKTPINSIKFSKTSSDDDIKETFISKIVRGIVNGLGQEEFVVNLGGASTARATNELKFFLRSKSGKAKTQLVPTETDIYLALNGDFEIKEDVKNAIAQAKTNKEIREIIEQTSLSDFIIHISSKDLSIAESSGGSISAKIKGEGALDSKIVAFEQLGQSMNLSKQVHQLIFEAVNTGEKLLYSESKYIDEVSRGITSLAFSFMFEDFEEQIQQINKDQTTNEIHLYLINGQYFTISEVLEILKQQIIKWGNNPNDLINVGFKPAPTSYYDELKDKMNHDLSLWNAVREATIKNTTMKVYMKVTNLKRALNRSL